MNNQSILIKCGGSIINNTEELTILLDNIALLKQQGFSIVIVHGGGPDITRLCKDLKLESQFINGQRVTSYEILEVTQMALLGRVNCNLVHKLNMSGVAALGLSGHDMSLIGAEFIDKQNMGYVGQVTQVNTNLLYSLLSLDITPVIAPIGVDNEGNSYNINADLVAGAVARELKVDKLVLLSDIDGFYLDFKDKNSLVELLDTKQIADMLAKSEINGGMIPKLTACEIAVGNGVKSAHIINGNNPHGLITLATTNKTVGTTIVRKI